MPTRYTRILHGDQVRIGGRDWRVIVGYGHAPEHASLYAPDLRVLISGDMVLPRISTNVSVFDYEPDANPLPLYLRSLDGYADLAEDTLVLPSHGRPFRGCMRASRSSTSITAIAWPKCWRPVRRGRSPRRTSCRCCSSASWTCTS